MIKNTDSQQRVEANYLSCSGPHRLLKFVNFGNIFLSILDLPF